MRPFEDLVVSTDASIRDAMAVIERGSVEIALVADGDHKLLATVTDCCKNGRIQCAVQYKDTIWCNY